MERVARGVTWFLAAAGLLALGGLAFELFGMSVQSARGQHQLEEAFEAGASSDDDDEQDGSLVELEIPALELVSYISRSADFAALKHGPGHVATTPSPGQAGTSVVAGHCRAYGGPFARLNQLRSGDDIYLTRPGGSRNAYRVEHVRAADTAQVRDLVNGHSAADRGDTIRAVAFVSCQVSWSSDARIIVTAVAAERNARPPGEAGVDGEPDDVRTPGSRPLGTWAKEPWAFPGWIAEPFALIDVALWGAVSIALVVGAVRALSQSSGPIQRLCIPFATAAPLVISLYMVYLNLYRIIPPIGTY